MLRRQQRLVTMPKTAEKKRGLAKTTKGQPIRFNNKKEETASVKKQFRSKDFCVRRQIAGYTMRKALRRMQDQMMR